MINKQGQSMNFKTLTGVILAFAVSGCVGAEITQAPVQFKQTKTLNEKGVSDFTARTYVKKKDGGRDEVVGVPCKFTAPGFYANFVTPAVVSTPDMGPRTPAGSVKCTYNDKEKLVVMRPFNETTAEIQANANSAGAGAGILGVIVSGISASTQMSRRNASLDIYGYSDASVVFETE